MCLSSMSGRSVLTALNGVRMTGLVCCYSVLGWVTHCDAASCQPEGTNICQIGNSTNPMFHEVHTEILDLHLYRLRNLARHFSLPAGYLTSLSWLACPPSLFLSSSLSTAPQLSPSLSSPSLFPVQVSPFLFPTQ